MKMRHALASVSGLAILTATGMSVHAQQGLQTPALQTSQPSASDANSGLEEIVVVAERRKENLQSVPIAVSVFTASMAEKLGVTDAQSLANMVPGLQFDRQTNSSTPFLRGVGTPVGQPGDEPSVAFYVDDVYYPSGSGSLANFNNLDRIEVEKGPQGTLFGRNATGGVIQVFTKDPTPDPTADIKLGYANYDTKSGSIYASGAISNKLVANIALYGSKQDDGWGRNVTTGNPTYTGWDYGGRIKFLFTPNDTTTLRLTLDQDSTRTEQGIGFHDYPGTLGGVGGVPGLTSPKPPSGYYDVAEDLDAYSIVRQEGVSLKATEDFNWARLVSITSFRQTRAPRESDDVDGTPLPLLDASISTVDKTWTQEFQLLSPEGSAIKWIGGLYYFNDVAGYDPIVESGLLFNPAPSLTAIQSSDSYSGFGQATATVLPDTHLTIGLRYTEDERTLRSYYSLISANGSFSPVVNAPNSPQSKVWPKLTYRLSLDHQFTPNIMGYIGYNRGFKSGVFNTVVSAAAPIAPAVQPETLDSYTIGVKNELFDQRLRLNAEAFYYKYKNIQIDEVLNGLTVLSNAAAATIKGIDVDAQFSPVKRLTVTASGELMAGHYDSFPNGVFFTYDRMTGGNVAGTANLAGYDTVHTPPFSLSVSMSYLIPMERFGDLALNVAYSHSGNYFSDTDNSRGQITTGFDHQSIVNLVNLSTNWSSEDKTWGVELWGKNVTGEKYFSYSVEDVFGTSYSPAPPATFGVNLTYHFGARVKEAIDGI
jgi:iron complex outermembrane receptor protein